MSYLLTAYIYICDYSNLTTCTKPEKLEKPAKNTWRFSHIAVDLDLISNISTPSDYPKSCSFLHENVPQFSSLNFHALIQI